MRIFTILIFTVLFLSSCGNRQVKSNPDSPVNTSIESPLNNDSLIFDLTKQILTAAKNKDYKKFSEFIHPALGLRFSPYSYIDTTKNVRLTAKEFLEAIKKPNKINWGNYDGSGAPILLSTEDYFKKFVYNADFLNAEKISLNDIIGKGNSINNLETIYKDCNYTESYFSGFDKKFEGHDWCSLRLVYKKYQDRFYLIAIVHDQWTI